MSKNHLYYVLDRANIEYDDETYCYNNLNETLRSVPCLISKFIRKGDEEMVKKICSIAMSDKNRTKSDLQLVLYNDKNRHLVKIAEMYGYIDPSILTIYDNIVDDYFHYSAVRTIMKKGSRELIFKVIQKNFVEKIFILHVMQLQHYMHLSKFIQIMKN